jgi:glycosyltransferase involved in cell wall biosynthesis
MTARAVSPLVSVVVPARNPEPEWLKAAIASAFQETDCRIEVVLVDDGSHVPLTSRSGLFDGLNVRIHRIPHGGVSRARNAGIDLCAGDFVRFLDADDAFLPGSTSHLLTLRHGRGPRLTYGSTLLCDPHLVPTGREVSNLHGWVHTAVALGRFRVIMPAILFPREVLEQVGGFDPDLVIQQDWDFVLRAAELAPVTGTRTPVYLYRRHANSSTAHPNARRHATRSTVKIIRSYMDRHPELVGTRAERRIRAYAQFLIAQFRGPEFPVRSQRFRRALLADPIRDQPRRLRGGRLELRRHRQQRHRHGPGRVPRLPGHPQSFEQPGRCAHALRQEAGKLAKPPRQSVADACNRVLYRIG